MFPQLTDEDWESDTAKNIAIVATFTLVFALAFVLTFALTFDAVSTIAAIALDFTILAIFALNIAVIALYPILCIFYPKAALFPGAYLHYRKRIKATKGE